MTFVERIDNLLAKRGVSRNQMLLEIKLGKNSFVNWTNRGNLPDGDVLIKLAQYFEVSIDYLLGYTPPQNTLTPPITPKFKSIQVKEDSIINVEYCDYDVFLSFFAPNGKLSKKTDNFIFRGLSTNEHKLIPTALRQNILNSSYKEHLFNWDKEELDYERTQIMYEFQLLRLFYQKSNDFGLKLPHVDALHNKFLPQNYNNIYFNQIIQCTSGVWVNSEFEELAALAQHYGVPTRLLDWTFDYKVAMYFAASKACKKILESKRSIEIEDDYMVIWAIDTNEVAKIKNLPLKIIVPSYYRNNNLNAQKGLLTHWENRTFDNKPKSGVSSMLSSEKTSSHSLSQELFVYSLKYNVDVSKILYKFKIPANQCIDMFDYLYHSRYNAANLFPGYEGVIKSFDEEAMLKKFTYNSNSTVAFAARNDNSPISKTSAEHLDDIPTTDEE